MNYYLHRKKNKEEGGLKLSQRKFNLLNSAFEPLTRPWHCSFFTLHYTTLNLYIILLWVFTLVLDNVSISFVFQVFDANVVIKELKVMGGGLAGRKSLGRLAVMSELEIRSLAVQRCDRATNCGDCVALQVCKVALNRDFVKAKY